jgi:xylulokinase
MARLLGIDVGTSGTKAVLIDETGRVLASAMREYQLHTPKPGWSEQDPADWVRAAGECLTAVQGQGSSSKGEEEGREEGIDAIGFTGQMHGLVCLDEADQVVRPAILWNDQRTAEECEEIDRVLGADRVREVTGNPPLTGFQAPKLLWLRKWEPELFAKVRSVLLPKDYVRFALTGVKATDVSDASGTGVFDLARREWWWEGIEELGFEREWFAQVCESSAQVCGATGPTPQPLLPGAAGVSPSPPAPLPRRAEGGFVVAGAGDQAAGAVGTGAVSPGVVSVSLGTSGVVFSSIESPVPDPTGAAHVFCHANGGWHAMGVMLSCGGAVRWARDTFFPKQSYDELTEAAKGAPIGCEGLTFLPYLSGERCPHNDPHARGALVGLSLAHTRGHIARAVFEGATFGMKDCLDRLVSLGVSVKSVRVTGGGAKSDFWMQLLADVFGAECVRVEGDEGPAFGAALLAGVAAGIWPSVEAACAATVKLGRAFQPSGADYSEALSRYRSLYPPLKDWAGG